MTKPIPLLDLSWLLIESSAGTTRVATPASYHDSMDFGFVANAAAPDDVPQLAHNTLQAYEELKEAAGRQPARPKRASSHRANVS